MELIFVAVAGTFILIGIVWYFIVAKLKKEAWEGELIDKREETGSGSDYDSSYYALYVKVIDGSSKRVTVRKKLYKQLNVGDKLIKVKGETYPKKA